VAGMDDLITRIVEIEKQCSAAVEEAQLDYGKNIEAHQRLLEEKKAKERARIIAAENTRLTNTIEEAKKQIASVSEALQRDNENLFQDSARNESIKKDMISILFEV
jgi:Fe2+ transport system protein B